MFHRAPGARSYGFLTNEQSYFLLKWIVPTTDDGGDVVATAVIPITRSDALGSGTNRLRVRWNSGRITLFLSGTEVATIEDITYVSGQVGLMVSSGAVVAFDDFEVTEFEVEPLQKPAGQM